MLSCWSRKLQPAQYLSEKFYLLMIIPLMQPGIGFDLLQRAIQFG